MDNMLEGSHAPPILVTIWRRILDNNAHEYCTICRSGAEIVVTGLIISASYDSEPAIASYRLHCSREMNAVSSVEISCMNGGERRELRLDREAGGWRVDRGNPVHEDCSDIDIEWTPLTNIFPLRRLTTELGETLEINALWIRLPSLQVEPTRQRYERTAAGHVRYTNVPRGFSALITHDPDGFPCDYEGVWAQVAKWSSES